MLTDLTTNIILIILGAIGFLLSFYIYIRKSAKKPLVCPLRSNCDKVVGSKYSEILGIPVEILGMVYYAFVVLSHVGLYLFPGIVDSFVMSFAILLSFGAFCFSVYLICVQAFILREWCFWCMTSAFVSFLIFIVTIIHVPSDVIAFLLAHKKIISALHLFGVAIGVGGAVISDLFFFKFLKDLKISFEESSMLNLLSGVIWVALAILVFTGMGLYLPQTDILHQSPKFLVKMIAIAVLILNGLALNFIIAPKLTSMTFDSIHAFHRFAFASGALSISTWLFVFTIGALRKIAISFPDLLLLYIVIITVAVASSQIFGASLLKIHSKE